MKTWPNVEKNGELVLRAPQHYHVRVFVYKSVTPEGVFQWSTEYNLVTNDVTLAVDQAKKMSGQPETHVGSVLQCSDPQHLEGV